MQSAPHIGLEFCGNGRCWDAEYREGEQKGSDVAAALLATDGKSADALNRGTVELAVAEGRTVTVGRTNHCLGRCRHAPVVRVITDSEPEFGQKAASAEAVLELARARTEIKQVN